MNKKIYIILITLFLFSLLNVGFSNQRTVQIISEDEEFNQLNIYWTKKYETKAIQGYTLKVYDVYEKEVINKKIENKYNKTSIPFNKNYNKIEFIIHFSDKTNNTESYDIHLNSKQTHYKSPFGIFDKITYKEGFTFISSEIKSNYQSVFLNIYKGNNLITKITSENSDFFIKGNLEDDYYLELGVRLADNSIVYDYIYTEKQRKLISDTHIENNIFHAKINNNNYKKADVKIFDKDYNLLKNKTLIIKDNAFSVSFLDESYFVVIEFLSKTHSNIIETESIKNHSFQLAYNRNPNLKIAYPTKNTIKKVNEKININISPGSYLDVYNNKNLLFKKLDFIDVKKITVPLNYGENNLTFVAYNEKEKMQKNITITAINPIEEAFIENSNKNIENNMDIIFKDNYFNVDYYVTPNIKISGYLLEANQLFLNNKSIRLKDDNNFDINLRLKSGENPISFKIVGKNGITKTKNYSIKYNPPKNSLKINSIKKIETKDKVESEEIKKINNIDKQAINNYIYNNEEYSEIKNVEKDNQTNKNLIIYSILFLTIITFYFIIKKTPN